MENIIDLIAQDSSASEITDSIKSAIFTKAMERIDAVRPEVANSLFGMENTGEEEE